MSLSTTGDQPTSTKDRWGDHPSPKQKALLETKLREWQAEIDHKGKRSPFDGTGLGGADIYWLVILTGMQQGYGIAAMEHFLRDRRGQGLGDLDLLDLDLADMHLEGANLNSAHLEGTHLPQAHLEGANLNSAHLEGADLRSANLTGAYLLDAYLQVARLDSAHLEGAHLINASLAGASLAGARLERASLMMAHLEGIELAALLATINPGTVEILSSSTAIVDMGGHEALRHISPSNRRIVTGRDKGGQTENGGGLEEEMRAYHATIVNRVLDANPELKGMLLGKVLPPANLTAAVLDMDTGLMGTILGDDKYGFVSAADVRWNDANLAAVNWTTLSRKGAMLGEEWEIRRRSLRRNGNEYFAEAAVRANRQLALALQGQGLNDPAAVLAYRAQRLRQVVLRWQHRWPEYLLSCLVWAISGYGYRPWRGLTAYLMTVTLFSVLYLLVGAWYSHMQHLTVLQAAILSATSFHGRGFFPGNWTSISVDEPYGVVASFEAFVGLVVEATFIATLTQRFFR